MCMLLTYGVGDGLRYFGPFYKGIRGSRALPYADSDMRQPARASSYKGWSCLA